MFIFIIKSEEKFKKTCRISDLDPYMYIFSKLFEIYLVTQSL